ncbi:uncharacterized protein DSM5745_03953 [Aspergillus mulundensis]|uniref:Uncharacterized protein n=1 Tax=Aspergillus mulundensis TaxID=1810919 RepID=A0A3D8SB90_9EURO|nr:hypothetical protein DSM5745_03953 [Aspergillus mulundensis]RDW83627.1 hypothetical protein DSM5745_03953 [Aspergillus mulundensis]
MENSKHLLPRAMDIAQMMVRCIVLLNIVHAYSTFSNVEEFFTLYKDWLKIFATASQFLIDQAGLTVLNECIDLIWTNVDSLHAYLTDLTHNPGSSARNARVIIARMDSGILLSMRRLADLTGPDGDIWKLYWRRSYNQGSNVLFAGDGYQHSPLDAMARFQGAMPALAFKVNLARDAAEAADDKPGNDSTNSDTILIDSDIDEDTPNTSVEITDHTMSDDKDENTPVTIKAEFEEDTPNTSVEITDDPMSDDNDESTPVTIKVEFDEDTPNTPVEITDDPMSDDKNENTPVRIKSEFERDEPAPSPSSTSSHTAEEADDELSDYASDYNPPAPARTSALDEFIRGLGPRIPTTRWVAAEHNNQQVADPGFDAMSDRSKDSDGDSWIAHMETVHIREGNRLIYGDMADSSSVARNNHPATQTGVDGTSAHINEANHDFVIYSNASDDGVNFDPPLSSPQPSPQPHGQKRELQHFLDQFNTVDDRNVAAKHRANTSPHGTPDPDSTAAAVGSARLRRSSWPQPRRTPYQAALFRRAFSRRRSVSPTSDQPLATIDLPTLDLTAAPQVSTPSPTLQTFDFSATSSSVTVGRSTLPELHLGDWLKESAYEPSTAPGSPTSQLAGQIDRSDESVSSSHFGPISATPERNGSGSGDVASDSFGQVLTSLGLDGSPPRDSSSSPLPNLNRPLWRGCDPVFLRFESPEHRSPSPPPNVSRPLSRGYDPVFPTFGTPEPNSNGGGITLRDVDLALFHRSGAPEPESSRAVEGNVVSDVDRILGEVADNLQAIKDRNDESESTQTIEAYVSDIQRILNELADNLQALKDRDQEDGYVVHDAESFLDAVEVTQRVIKNRDAVEFASSESNVGPLSGDEEHAGHKSALCTELWVAVQTAYTNGPNNQDPVLHQRIEELSRAIEQQENGRATRPDTTSADDTNPRVTSSRSSSSTSSSDNDSDKENNAPVAAPFSPLFVPDGDETISLPSTSSAAADSNNENNAPVAVSSSLSPALDSAQPNISPAAKPCLRPTRPVKRPLQDIWDDESDADSDSDSNQGRNVTPNLSRNRSPRGSINAGHAGLARPLSEIRRDSSSSPKRTLGDAFGSEELEGQGRNVSPKNFEDRSPRGTDNSGHVLFSPGARPAGESDFPLPEHTEEFRASPIRRTFRAEAVEIQNEYTAAVRNREFPDDALERAFVLGYYQMRQGCPPPGNVFRFQELQDEFDKGLRDTYNASPSMPDYEVDPWYENVGPEIGAQIGAEGRSGLTSDDAITVSSDGESSGSAPSENGSATGADHGSEDGSRFVIYEDASRSSTPANDAGPTSPTYSPPRAPLNLWPASPPLAAEDTQEPSYEDSEHTAPSGTVGAHRQTESPSHPLASNPQPPAHGLPDIFSGFLDTSIFSGFVVQVQDSDFAFGSFGPEAPADPRLY